MPGDWVYTANQLPDITVGGTGGPQGNGLIAGTMPAAGLATAANEVGVAPSQLYAAGLLGKIGTNTQMRLQTQFGAVHMAVANAANTSAAYVAANPAVKNAIIFFNLPCEVVIEVDRAIDDGVDTTGRAMGSAACTAGGSLTRYFVPL